MHDADVDAVELLGEHALERIAEMRQEVRDQHANIADLALVALGLLEGEFAGEVALRCALTPEGVSDPAEALVELRARLIRLARMSILQVAAR